MSFAGDAGARPPPVSFTALSTGETFYMPYVPETFQESIKVNWSDQTILGMSHKNLQYANTDNHTFEKFSFWFKGETPEEVRRIHDGRKFLMSLCYAPTGAGSVRLGGPTRILFIWPLVVTMICVVNELTITHEKFNREGLTVNFRAEIGLTEIRDRRLGYDEVRSWATLRQTDRPSDEGSVMFFNESLELRNPPEGFGQ